MKRFVFLTLASVLLLPSIGRSQPVVNAAVNVASFLRPQLPNGKLAQGVMFTTFGSGQGPATLAQSGFPLPADLAGASIQVIVNGTVVDCPMVIAQDARLFAVLPSSTPIGVGTLTATFNGQTSAPLQIEVTAHAFGIFALNQSGSGAGIFTDPTASVVRAGTITDSARPGELWDIWGAGVGAAPGDESAGPLPADLPYSVQVFVGGVEAQVVYRGRSGCCAGIDQIRIVIPSGVLGCYLPVVVVVGGVPSNFTTISISDAGGLCSDPAGGTPADLSVLDARGELRSGQVILGRTLSEVTLPTEVQLQRSDNASATFFRLDRTTALAAIGFVSTLNSCLVSQIPGVPVIPEGLDAGAVTLTTPTSTHNMPRFGTGAYSLIFNPAAPALTPEPASQAVNALLSDGVHTFTGAGGSQIGAFTAQIDLPPRTEWSNRAATTIIDRTQPLRITWTNPPPNGFILITGFSAFELGPQGFVGAQFNCRAEPAAGFFDIPVAVLGGLPPSFDNAGSPGGSLTVSGVSFSNRFQADGVDFGLAFHSDTTGKNVTYR